MTGERNYYRALRETYRQSTAFIVWLMFCWAIHNYLVPDIKEKKLKIVETDGPLGQDFVCLFGA